MSPENVRIQENKERLAGAGTPQSPAYRTWRFTVDTTESSAPHAHPSTEEQDDTVEAHYACLERPCACLEGWVFVGYIDEYGEEKEASYACRRCADSR
jgi:hypothetical protein